MIKDLQYVELSKTNVGQNVLQTFDCGHPDFNEYLANDASRCGENGQGVTYVLVSKKQYEANDIKIVFAFATIQTMGLYFHKDEKLCCLPAAEIKYFAVSRYFQGETAYAIHPSKKYSTIFFEWFLIELYEISIRVIGFAAIFLRANKAGEKLYRLKQFAEAQEYMNPYCEDDPLNECVPLMLVVQDELYSIFGVK